MAFLLRKPRVLCSSVSKSLAKSLHKSTTDGTTATSDALTDFTDELIIKNQLRWEIQQQRQNRENKLSNQIDVNSLKQIRNLINSVKKITEPSISEVMFLSVDFEKLEDKHIDHLLLTACHDKNTEFIEMFVHQCVDANKVISEYSAITICEYFSTMKESKTLIKLIDLCKSNNRLVFDQNCEFKHFVARNLWEKGNSHGALTLLDEAFEQANEKIRESIRSVFRFIVDVTVEKKSEAVLLRVVKSAEHLLQRLNEPSVLLYLWKICFTSEWFSDQIIADKLFSEHKEIRTNAAKR